MRTLKTRSLRSVLGVLAAMFLAFPAESLADSPLIVDLQTVVRQAARAKRQLPTDCMLCKRASSTERVPPCAR